MSKLYHASFTGQAKRRFGALYDYKVLVTADSIYDVQPFLEERYDFIHGLCVTSCEDAGIEFFELSEEMVEIPVAI